MACKHHQSFNKQLNLLFSLENFLTQTTPFIGRFRAHAVAVRSASFLVKFDALTSENTLCSNLELYCYEHILSCSIQADRPTTVSPPAKAAEPMYITWAGNHQGPLNPWTFREIAQLEEVYPWENEQHTSTPEHEP